MRPILLPALATVAALSQPACGPAAAIGTVEWWRQRQSDKPASSSTCHCPDCSASWPNETTVPSHYRDFDSFNGACSGAGKEVPVNALEIGEIVEFGPPAAFGYTEAIGVSLAGSYQLRNRNDRLAVQGEFADFLVGFVMLTDAIADRERGQRS